MTRRVAGSWRWVRLGPEHIKHACPGLLGGQGKPLQGYSSHGAVRPEPSNVRRRQDPKRSASLPHRREPGVRRAPLRLEAWAGILPFGLRYGLGPVGVSDLAGDVS